MLRKLTIHGASWSTISAVNTQQVTINILRISCPGDRVLKNVLGANVESTRSLMEYN